MNTLLRAAVVDVHPDRGMAARRRIRSRPVREHFIENIYIYIYIYTRISFISCNIESPETSDFELIIVRPDPIDTLRPFFILRIVGPRILESKVRNHCAKKLVGALRKPTSSV